ncbi:hypothetical protein M878_10415 [Streptomyces roseochromogenus subsp. oscitans DS 12.976]|uniref:Uncharacterized protein n=1 Tax=Streptomyces roseochromogenus subsp. oscitans DS 12.976 TaxID=1352936 RepID=V6KQE2_STRRC|nr:hypothetical protein M878_10415 [Streptomyces roseochromogenus subsp. oscitans DS 12.976]
MTPLVGDVDDGAGRGATFRSVRAGVALSAARTTAAQEAR